ncbi:MAG: DUF2892 domain-containing protein [Desulfobacterales bacterium]|nr:DUF2892 domain-containing protein [Desulfobacterales bacterium]
MKINVGRKERLIRLPAGLVLVFFGVVWSWVLSVAGVVVLATAVIGWCPVSALLGFNTAGREDAEIVPDTSGPRSDPYMKQRRLK